MRWHLRLGHLSFYKLRVMAALGILPKRLLKDKVPKCSSCIYGSMMNKAWKSRGKDGQRKIIPANAPRDCASVDDKESRTPGFVAQHIVMLTKIR